MFSHIPAVLSRSATPGLGTPGLILSASSDTLDLPDLLGYTSLMPIQQQMVIWILVIIAAVSAGYSLITGQLFPQKTVVTAQNAAMTPTPVSPTPADASLNGILSQFQKQLANKQKQATPEGATSSTPRPTRDLRHDQVCTARSASFSYTSFAKGQSLRVDFKASDKAGTLIAAQNTLYAWEDKTVIGAKIPLKEADFSTDEILILLSEQAIQNGAKEMCTAKDVPNSQFTPPRTVIFSPIDASAFGIDGLF